MSQLFSGKDTTSQVCVFVRTRDTFWLLWLICVAGGAIFADRRHFGPGPATLSLCYVKFF